MRAELRGPEALAVELWNKAVRYRRWVHAPDGA